MIFCVKVWKSVKIVEFCGKCAKVQKVHKLPKMHQNHTFSIGFFTIGRNVHFWRIFLQKCFPRCEFPVPTETFPESPDSHVKNGKIPCKISLCSSWKVCSHLSRFHAWVGICKISDFCCFSRKWLNFAKFRILHQNPWFVKTIAVAPAPRPKKSQK